MGTLHQLLQKFKRLPKYRYKRNTMLNKCPQKRGKCRKVFIVKPKKPNSANRKVTRLYVDSTKKYITAYIPGIGHNLVQDNIVLFRAGRVRDLPGIRYKLIRNASGYDFKPVEGRKTSRSKYGVKKK